MKGLVLRSSEGRIFLVRLTKEDNEFHIVQELEKNDDSQLFMALMNSIDDFLQEYFIKNKEDNGLHVFSVTSPDNKTAAIYGCTNDDYAPEKEEGMLKIVAATMSIPDSPLLHWVDIEPADCKYNEPDNHVETIDILQQERFYKLPLVRDIFAVPFTEGKLIEKECSYYVISNDVRLCEFLEETEPITEYKEIASAPIIG